MRNEYARAVVVVDVAGAAMGGAQRYLVELDRWLAGRNHPIEVIGRNRALGSAWLVAREFLAARTGRHASVALNNVSFVGTGQRRTVLLRNALHFMAPTEGATFPELARRIETQGRLVRLVMRRADRIVVPSDSMRTRVVARCPWAGRRIEVMPHPVTPLAPSPDRDSRKRVVLCPVLGAPYKQLGRHLKVLLRALSSDSLLSEVKVLVTATDSELAQMGIRADDRLVPLGRLTTVATADAMQRATVLYFPTELESFGYPLAEARVNRVPVVAKRTPLAVEVAGDALVPYDSEDVVSLAEALHLALTLKLGPLGSNPYEPDAYFRRLFLDEGVAP